MNKLISTLLLFLVLGTASLTANAQYKWGSWSTDPCFSGVQFRARYDDYNEFAKKHKWSIQYRNNYTRDIAFSYNLGSTREEVLKDIREKRGTFRTRIKPGQIDSGMWVLTNSQGQILETMGHARLLGSDEVDYKGPFLTCDSVGNRGQIDTICRNEPNPYVGCQNHVSPPPAAITFPNKPWRNDVGGKTEAASAPPASPADCLELYKYFSKYSKADDPLAVKQSLDAANAFKARCKLSVEQLASVDVAIFQTRDRLERIKPSSALLEDTGTLITNVEPVRKVDINDLKQQFVEYLNGNLEHNSSVLKGSVSVVQGRLKLVSSIYDQEFIAHSDFANVRLNPQCGGAGPCVEVTYDTPSFGFSQLPLRNGALFATTVEKSNDLLSQIRAAEKGVESGPANLDQNSNPGDATKGPTSEAEYQKDVVAEAKAKGIKIESDSTDQKLKPRPILTPRQRAAEEAESSKRLSELIESDNVRSNGFATESRSNTGQSRNSITLSGRISDSLLPFAFDLPATRSGEPWAVLYMEANVSNPNISMRANSSNAESINVVETSGSDVAAAVSKYRTGVQNAEITEKSFDVGTNSGVYLKYVIRSPVDREMRVLFLKRGPYVYKITVSANGQSEWLDRAAEAIAKGFTTKYL